MKLTSCTRCLVLIRLPIMTEISDCGTVLGFITARRYAQARSLLSTGVSLSVRLSACQPDGCKIPFDLERPNSAG